jgi:hypothetical protein
VQLVQEAFAAQPQLMVLLLQDAADPGFPSFPVLRVDSHLQLFGRLLPQYFINQGGLGTRVPGCQLNAAVWPQPPHTMQHVCLC